MLSGWIGSFGDAMSSENSPGDNSTWPFVRRARIAFTVKHGIFEWPLELEWILMACRKGKVRYLDPEQTPLPHFDIQRCPLP